ncbi:meiosis-specific transcription factor Ndt80p [[Candida] anglica]|uniref:Meiosis-specific transcription factor Ndt80p n=1 Tax=[Candida] anglica TaxID=148631 RepID=A0ABP0EN64_9ASCO
MGRHKSKKNIKPKTPRVYKHKVKREDSSSDQIDCDDDDDDEPYEPDPWQKKGSISTNSKTKPKKDKIAPRSSLQFKVGPSFEKVLIDTPLYSRSSGATITPVINSRVDRGFDLIDGEWIGYKRNYFTLVTAFEFKYHSRKQVLNDSFFVMDSDGRLEIKFFALRIVSKCVEDGIMVNLIQHTAKRDKGPQISPPVYPSVPGTLPTHFTIKSAANIRNDAKIAHLNKLFFLSSDEAMHASPNKLLSTYPIGPISIAARYERIQFSTSINCRKYSTVNRHFILTVQLLGFFDDDKSVILAHSSTPELVIRGRSPSNYQLELLNSNNRSVNSKTSDPNGVETSPMTDRTSSVLQPISLNSVTRDDHQMNNKRVTEVSPRKPKKSRKEMQDEEYDLYHYTPQMSLMMKQGERISKRRKKRIDDIESSQLLKPIWDSNEFADDLLMTQDEYDCTFEREQLHQHEIKHAIPNYFEDEFQSTPKNIIYNEGRPSSSNHYVLEHSKISQEYSKEKLQDDNEEKSFNEINNYCISKRNYILESSFMPECEIDEDDPEEDSFLIFQRDFEEARRQVFNVPKSH